MLSVPARFALAVGRSLVGFTILVSAYLGGSIAVFADEACPCFTPEDARVICEQRGPEAFRWGSHGIGCGIGDWVDVWVFTDADPFQFRCAGPTMMVMADEPIAEKQALACLRSLHDATR